MWAIFSDSNFSLSCCERPTPSDLISLVVHIDS